MRFTKNCANNAYILLNGLLIVYFFKILKQTHVSTFFH
jgi:hypothetical protein